MFWVGYISSMLSCLTIVGFFVYFEDMFSQELSKKATRIGMVAMTIIGFSLDWETGLGVIAGIASLFLLTLAVTKLVKKGRS